MAMATRHLILLTAALLLAILVLLMVFMNDVFIERSNQSVTEPEIIDTNQNRTYRASLPVQEINRENNLNILRNKLEQI